MSSGPLLPFPPKVSIFFLYQKMRNVLKRTRKQFPDFFLVFFFCWTKFPFKVSGTYGVCVLHQIQSGRGKFWGKGLKYFVLFLTNILLFFSHKYFVLFSHKYFIIFFSQIFYYFFLTNILFFFSHKYFVLFLTTIFFVTNIYFFLLS